MKNTITVEGQYIESYSIYKEFNENKVIFCITILNTQTVMGFKKETQFFRVLVQNEMARILHRILIDKCMYVFTGSMRLPSRKKFVITIDNKNIIPPFVYRVRKVEHSKAQAFSEKNCKELGAKSGKVGPTYKNSIAEAQWNYEDEENEIVEEICTSKECNAVNYPNLTGQVLKTELRKRCVGLEELKD